MIQDLKNICSRKHIKYLIMLLIGMFIAAILEMIGLSSIPIFIMIIIDIDVLINKFPTFFANDYIKKLLKKKRREVSESFAGGSRGRLIKEDPWTVCVMREGLRPVHPAY